MYSKNGNGNGNKTGAGIVKASTQSVSDQSNTNNLKRFLDSYKGQIAAALPKHLTVERLMKVALIEARKNKALGQADPISFLGAIVQAGTLGLEPGGTLGHCWLIPYNSNKHKQPQVNFQVGYRGMIDLAMRSDRVSHVVARTVHEGDEFNYEFGMTELISHRPCSRPGEMTHVYCIVFLKNGFKMFDVMSRDEVESVRDKFSKSYQNAKDKSDTIWETHFDEMAKKTVIRRLFKMMPISVELQQAITLDEQAERKESQRNSAVLEAEGITLPEGYDEEETEGSNENAVPTESIAEKLKREQAEQANVVKEPAPANSDPDSFENFK